MFQVVIKSHVEAKVTTFELGDGSALDEMGRRERQHGEFISLGVEVNDSKGPEDGLACGLVVGGDGGQRVL
jgi:hypothetical protein